MTLSADSELGRILNGSESVQERIRQFYAAKEEADRSFEALRIGQDAKAAYDAANAAHAEARIVLERANKAADEAIRTAAEIAEKQAALDVALARAVAREEQSAEAVRAAEDARHAADAEKSIAREAAQAAQDLAGKLRSAIRNLEMRSAP